ncbi:unnamed protein product [Pleuronectes platessa]|uniref:Uncharacterized protein n=1 Tax=Pleuronectes platessa TaxID=8262 RepID=A0A9N7YQM5_PLEPL|nr:unnamed protein product [Pleuronectes platessa]
MQYGSGKMLVRMQIVVSIHLVNLGGSGSSISGDLLQGTNSSPSGLWKPDLPLVEKCMRNPARLQRTGLVIRVLCHIQQNVWLLR